MSTIQFKCPSCGGEKFSVAAEPNTYDDFIGAPCAGCGRPLTDEDIKRQAREIAVKLAKEAFKGR